MSSIVAKADALLARSATIRWLTRLIRLRLTAAGKLLLAGAVIALMLGMNYEFPVYFLFAGAAMAIAAAAAAALLAGPVRIKATRALPRHVCAGERIRYEVLLENQGRRAARDLELVERGLPPELALEDRDRAALDFLPPGGRAAVPLGLVCRKRGVYPLPGLQPSSSFPSGLVRRFSPPGTAAELMVYPAFTRLADFPLPAPRRYQPGGLAMTSDVGDSTEFLSTREWRYGDSVRDIHWASWARAGTPVVKEYQEEYFVRLALLLDSQVADEDDAAFEAGVSLAASIADVLSRKDYIIDLFAVGEEIHRFQAGRALAHFDNVLEILACVVPAKQVDMAGVLRALGPESDRLSALVCVMMDWDEARRRLCHGLGSLGLATRIVVVKKQAPTLPIAGDPDVSWRRPEELLETFK